MAQKVREIPERVLKYPWGDWFDGDIWELTPGQDFTIKIENFRQAAYAAAESRGYKVTVRTSQGRLYLKATRRVGAASDDAT